MTMTALQRISLVLLRTLIGWHFAYEGYYKLVVPGWTRDGVPVRGWSAAGYLQGATGPFADAFHALATTGLMPWIDILIPVCLLLVGLSLLLGLLTQPGAWGALALLTMFYLASIPTSGTMMPGAEGTYLLVNKTLIEWAGVLVILVSRTGRIAGLDLLWSGRRLAAERPVSVP
jgi:thiosulfate dehydrogenase [quinone] large subunit